MTVVLCQACGEDVPVRDDPTHPDPDGGRALGRHWDTECPAYRCEVCGATGEHIFDYRAVTAPREPGRLLCPKHGAEHVANVAEAAGIFDPPPSYTCPTCGRTSYHPDDVRNEYCGACHTFAADQRARRGAIREWLKPEQLDKQAARMSDRARAWAIVGIVAAALALVAAVWAVVA